MAVGTMAVAMPAAERIGSATVREHRPMQEMSWMLTACFCFVMVVHSILSLFQMSVKLYLCLHACAQKVVVVCHADLYGCTFVVCLRVVFDLCYGSAELFVGICADLDGYCLPFCELCFFCVRYVCGERAVFFDCDACYEVSAFNTLSRLIYLVGDGAV